MCRDRVRGIARACKGGGGVTDGISSVPGQAQRAAPLRAGSIRPRRTAVTGRPPSMRNRLTGAVVEDQMPLVAAFLAEVE